MSVERRLARLEQSNRRLRVAVTAFALLAMGAVSIAMTSGSRDLDVSTLRARKIIVLDEQGKPRIESFHAVDGTFGLAINDDNGARRVRLFDSPTSGKGAVQCLYASGDVAASLAAHDAGADLSLHAVDGSPTFAANWSASDSASTVQLAAPETKNRVVLRSRTVGDAGLFVLDQMGTPRLSLLAKADHDATIVLYDQEGRRRLSHGTRGESEAFSRVFDAQHALRLEAATMGDGTTVLRSVEAVTEEK